MSQFLRIFLPTLVKRLSVAREGLLRDDILKEHQDALPAADGHVKFDVPEGIRLVHCHLPLPQYPVIQNRKAAFVLVIDHSSQLRMCDHVIYERYASDVIRGVGIACGLDHTVVAVERQFILEPVDQCALVKWRVACTWSISDGPVSGNA